ncbi:hypothetical protein HC766_00465 [Candidatus Gracilibacteria bacterium]|nr:hypothetical protein [Candidatus Gracilibacteria bacterium]
MSIEGLYPSDIIDPEKNIWTPESIEKFNKLEHKTKYVSLGDTTEEICKNVNQK